MNGGQGEFGNWVIGQCPRFHRFHKWGNFAPRIGTPLFCFQRLSVPGVGQFAPFGPRARQEGSRRWSLPLPKLMVARGVEIAGMRDRRARL